MVGIILLIALILVILLLIFLNIRIVPQAHIFVIERLGRFQTVWNAGLHVKAPFVDRIAGKVSIKEQVLDTPPQPVITKDNVTIQVDAVVYYHIFDAELYTYGAQNPVLALANLSATTLRNIIGSLTLDDALVSRDTINAQLTALLDNATDPWGIKVTRVELRAFEIAADIRDAMNRQMKSERERRQTVLEAEGHKQAVITRAEGDKQAKILAAEAERDAQIALAQGRAKSIQLVYLAEAEGLERLSKANMTESVLKLKGIEALKDVADGRATKIYMPSDITNIVANLGVAGEALGVGDSTPIDRTAKPQKALTPDPCLKTNPSRGAVDAYLTTEQIQSDLTQRRFTM